MVQPEAFFGNQFSDPKITTTRLADFTADFLNNMTADNGDKKYDALIALLTKPYNDVKNELGDVASSLAFQKGGTKTNDQVLSLFKVTMSAKRGVIAEALGGEDTPAYLAFYPQGGSQYARATKTTMPTLTQQVAAAVKVYGGKIGGALAELLQLFPQQWEDSRNSQQQQKGTVKDNRTDRSANRIQLELALTQAVHTIGQMYPGQVGKCLSLFGFAMLYPQTKHKHEVFSDAALAPATSDTVVNRTFTDTYEISIHNSDDNAPIAAWLAASETETYPGSGVEVQPGKTAIVKPSKLSDLSHTFLRILNLSDVNDGSYEVEIS